MEDIFHRDTLLLEEDDIVSLVKEKIGLEEFLDKLYDALEEGFGLLAAKRITVLARHEFDFAKGSILSMTAADRDHFICKVVNTHSENPSKHNIPSVIASGLLLDGETGYPMMLTESTLLTALRTGTTSAIATKYLSKRSSKTIGIIGNGVEAIPHLHAISRIRDIDKVYAYDIDKNASQSFKGSAEHIIKIVDTQIVDHVADLCEESDIIVTVTCKEKNTPPILLNKWITNGIHINAIGGAYLNQVELEKSLIDRSKLVVDFKHPPINVGERQQVSKQKIYADLSEIIMNVKGSRINDDEITIFDSVGFAMEDLQVYKLVYKLAIDNGFTKRIKIGSTPRYSKDLYRSYFL